MSRKLLTSLILICILAACTSTVPGSIPTALPIPDTETPDPISSITSVPATATSNPQMIVTAPVASPISTSGESWVDFTNSYYGYTISVPASAKVTKNEEISSYNLDDVPADWNPEDNFADYLNMTYPPGTCVSIEYDSAYIQIKAADSLGGNYAVDCSSFGGLGVANWVWTEENVTIGETDYTATVVRQCDEQNQNCGDGTYGIQIGDGAGFVLFNVGPGNQGFLFEILRSYRPAPKTELYCPKPVASRLVQGQYAFVSTDPPLAHNNVRTAPGINQELIGKIAPGEAFELLEGPVCNNSLQWWKVSVLRSGLNGGWIPEGDHRSYWLVPCESKAACGVPE